MILSQELHVREVKLPPPMGHLPHSSASVTVLTADIAAPKIRTGRALKGGS